MKVLVSHGITPTGVGIAQVGIGHHLRPLSPCCGTPMNYTEDATSVTCSGCHENLKALYDSVRPKTLGNDVFISRHGDINDTIVAWIRVITGDETATMEVES